jgi:hypothetical protein
MLGTSFVEFKLNYSGTKNLPIGEYIVDIDSILAGGRSWTIRCYPRGVGLLGTCPTMAITSLSTQGPQANPDTA